MNDWKPQDPWNFPFDTYSVISSAKKSYEPLKWASSIEVTAITVYNDYYICSIQYQIRTARSKINSLYTLFDKNGNSVRIKPSREPVYSHSMHNIKTWLQKNSSNLTS